MPWDDDDCPLRQASVSAVRPPAGDEIPEPQPHCPHCCSGCFLAARQEGTHVGRSSHIRRRSSCTRARKHAPTRTHTHTDTHTHKHTNTNTNTHKHINTYRRALTRTPVTYVNALRPRLAALSDGTLLLPPPLVLLRRLHCRFRASSSPSLACSSRSSHTCRIGTSQCTLRCAVMASCSYSSTAAPPTYVSLRRVSASPATTTNQCHHCRCHAVTHGVRAVNNCATRSIRVFLSAIRMAWSLGPAQGSVSFAVILSILVFELTTKLESKRRIGLALVLQLFVGKGVPHLHARFACAAAWRQSGRSCRTRADGARVLAAGQGRV